MYDVCYELILVLRIFRGVVDFEILEGYLSNIDKKSGDSDFHMLSLIRFIYSAKNGPDVDSSKHRIVDTMLDFPYWPKVS